MKLDLFSQAGKKLSTGVEGADSVFATKVNRNLLAQYVHVYLSNQRAAIASTLDRGEVRGGGRKPWRQKGTGNARAGSSRSPIWRKGGITFGPRSNKNWKITLNKKMRQAAMRSAFSMVTEKGGIRFVDSLTFAAPQMTQKAKQFIADMKLDDKKVLIITSVVQNEVRQAFSNLPRTNVIQIGELSAYDLINAQEVIVVQDAATYINETWTK